jgi:hypothetical protein
VENHEVEKKQQYDYKGKCLINGHVGFGGLTAVITMRPVFGI